VSKFREHFTVEEANALLPSILSIFERVHAIREEMSEHQEEFEQTHKAAPTNGGSRDGSEMVSQSEAVGRLLMELEDKGIVLKDIDAGLIDFPHMREDEEVFLCWKIGEQRVTHWHALNAGFRGRQPL
jgi:hypothetical protein